MTETLNLLANYLHDVFVIKFDAWVVLGFAAQALFTMRFVVQWIASERARKSVMPVAFLQSCVILPLSSASEAGTKSAQRNQ